MQCGVDVPVYKRIDENKKNNKYKITPIRILLIVLAGVMLSRVKISFSEGLMVAPFGIAYLLSVMSKENEKISFVAFLSSCVGYLSIYNNNNDYYIYPIALSIIFFWGYICKKLDKSIKVGYLYVVNIALFLIFGLAFGKYGTMINLSLSLLKGFVIIPSYYVINYGINCTKEINNNYFYSIEELISMAILLCLVVAGVGDIEIFNISIRNILALSSVIVIAYAGEAAVGAVVGIAMGMIIGIVNNDILLATATCSICGMMVGVFKETGKIVSTITYLLCAIIVNAYAGNLYIDVYIEIGIAALILLFIPTKVIQNILSEISNDEKSKKINSIRLDGAKSEIVEQIDKLKSVLSTISTAMMNLNDNKKLVLKNRGSALVENLADRVCSNCEMNTKCWGKEINNTYFQFEELLGNIENGKKEPPRELLKKCVKLNTLLKRSEDLYCSYTVNEGLKDRYAEGRKLVANQINDVSLVINDVINEFEKNIYNCYEIDKVLKKSLARNKIRYNNIYSYTDKKGRIKIKIKIDNSDGETYCSKYILPLISDYVKAPLCICEEKSQINPETNECTILIEESTKYHIMTYTAFQAKDGERYSGDCFNFWKNYYGVYITVLSDGMGSGPLAGEESNMAVDLVEKFVEGGFDEITALNAINSIMNMKFNENEKFTTLDMNMIDLYNGEATFIKAGGVCSFIKNSKGVIAVSDNTLPLGVADKLESKMMKKKLKHGDIVVTISDGILEVDKNNIGDYSWIRTFLEKASLNPEVLARDILDKAKEVSGGKVLDDMTVVVSKLYSSY